MNTTARALWIATAGVGALTLVFLAGRWTRPANPETDPALFAARAATLKADSLRRVDSLAVLRARARTDSAVLAATRAVRRANTAEARSVALRDSVRVLSDSSVTVTRAETTVVLAVPPEVVTRMRADSVTIGALGVALTDQARALWLASVERDTTTAALASANLTLAALRRQQPLELAASYARGKRVGRIQVISGLAGVVGVGVGLKLAGVFR